MFRLFGAGGRIAAIGLVLGLSLGAYAITAGSSVGSSRAGDGNGNVTGYNVAGFQETLNSSNANYVDSFTFNLDAPANAVYAYANGTGNVISCTSGATNPVTCPATGSANIAVSTFNSVQVIAAQ